MDQPPDLRPPSAEPAPAEAAALSAPPPPGGWYGRLMAHPLYERWSEPAYIFLLFWCIYALSGSMKPTHYVAHVWIAKAILEGHFWVDGIPAYFEQTRYGGHTYMAYGIGPSLLMVPFVAVFGLAFNQATFCAALGAASVAVWWMVLGKLDVLPAWRTWLTACYGLGSLFWFYAGQSGNTWALMHVLTCLGLMIAIYDCVSKQRGWLAGLGLAFAVLSRQTVFLSLPFFVGMMWRNDRAEGGRAIWQKALYFAIGLGVPLAFNAFYNYMRFDNPMDNGYAKVINEYQKLPYGFFHLHYLWTNLSVYIWGIPERLQHFPWFNPTQGGFSMFISTPALLFVAFANWRERINVLALIALLPIFAFYLVYHWTGYAQFGCRYSLDFLPFAMLLVASAFRNRWGTALTTAVLFGGLVELWGLFWWGIKEW